jgi:hypothetical protein
LDFALGTTLKKQYLKIVQKGSREFDEQTQAPALSHLHSMRQKGEEAAVALQKRDKFVEATLKNARSLARRGQCEAALKLLGEALHPLMDASSPPHRDADGNPAVWDTKNLKEVARHSPTEASGEETARHLTQEILKAQRDIVQSAYNYVFEEECPCKKKIEIRDISSE